MCPSDIQIVIKKRNSNFKNFRLFLQIGSMGSSSSSVIYVSVLASKLDCASLMVALLHVHFNSVSHAQFLVHS